MHVGKISENILKRSVLKKITYKSKSLLHGPSAGEDCARIRPDGEKDMVFTVNPVVGDSETVGRKAFYKGINDIAAAGAVPAAMLVSMILPEDSDESMIKCIMGQIGELAEIHKVDILGGHTEISPYVSRPVISVTGTGYAGTEEKIRSGELKPGHDIVMTKWAGAFGAAEIVRTKRKELEARFSGDFLDRTEEYCKWMSCMTDARIAVESGAAAMHNASDGGIFDALWEIAEASGTGLQVELKKIPIRQETIEVCEFFDYNPYMISSEGALLIGTADGDRLVGALDKAGIPAAVIGKATGDHDRVILNEDERRFLVPPGN